jgi:hypothetical protein
MSKSIGVRLYSRCFFNYSVGFMGGVILLDERQIKCAELISKGIPIVDIPVQVGVNRSTIYEWKKLEEFNAEVDRLQQEFISSARGRLRAAAIPAADKLIDLLKNSKYEKTKLAAAIDILDRGLGKATTKVEVNSKDDKAKVSADVLDSEIDEFENE